MFLKVAAPLIFSVSCLRWLKLKRSLCGKINAKVLFLLHKEATDLAIRRKFCDK